MVETVAAFGFGLVVLVVSTQWFVKIAEKISVAAKISPLVVGATVVALGTSLPELVVSVTAAMRQDFGLAVGNIVGSNISNVLLVLPLGILKGRVRIGTTKTPRYVLPLGAATALFLVVNLSSQGVGRGGLLLFAGAIAVTVLELFWGLSGRDHEDGKRFKKSHAPKITPGDVLLLFGVLVGILGGGIIVVNSVENLATLTGLSTTFLGLTLTAIGTSIPELLATFFSVELKEDKMTVGNILGSNIYNLLAIGGILAMIGYIPIIDWQVGLFLIASTAMLGWMIFKFKGRNVPKQIAFMFLGGFCLYMLSLRS
ncbi:hypothetical protein A2397_02800 [Candidatus Amesbacteria bacterium RIFOXYB1_FULL_44_23]|uniref:Sodium/calcium exchanger membrane region domain-containing protein n=1 Tax=Candidatus Amesbacteria bacterium RIFOXYB1_FULL_44_23 TaxID=1797263 RepID=A0A1F4ZTZ5_9BACT|nr:MAG: hypothetical protein A2397_02800 [Candidatus Amesbacteria bacterium RIFOXYB1_FULL_44_23]